LQGIDRRNLLLRSWFQPYMAYTCIAAFSTILLFNGFTAFLHSFDISTFFASYITLPVFVICWGGYRVVKKKDQCGIAHLEDTDLSHGPPQALRNTRYDLTPTHGLVQPVIKA
jgi:amino acid transporter